MSLLEKKKTVQCARQASLHSLGCLHAVESGREAVELSVLSRHLSLAERRKRSRKGEQSKVKEGEEVLLPFETQEDLHRLSLFLLHSKVCYSCLFVKEEEKKTFLAL